MALLTNTTYDLNGTTINVAPLTSCCKLVYDAGKVIGFTTVAVSKAQTAKTLECYPTDQEGLDRITALGLTGHVAPITEPTLPV